MREQLHGRQATSATEVNGFGHFAHGINDAFVVIEGHVLLREIAEAHGLANDEATAVGSHLSEEHPNEGTLACAILANDAHLLITRKVVVEILEDDQRRIVGAWKGFADILRLENLAADIRILPFNTCGPLFHSCFRQCL